jgi:hypothetical protein
VDCLIACSDGAVVHAQVYTTDVAGSQSGMHGYIILQALVADACAGSGIHSAIHGKVRAGDV